MIDKPHRTIEPTTSANVIHQSHDGKVTEKKRSKRDIRQWKAIWRKEQEKYK